MSDQQSSAAPATSPGSHYDAFFAAATKSCILIHLLWLVLFWALGVMPMAMYNFVSTCFFAWSLQFLLGKHNRTWALLVHMEVRLHMVLASIMVGWDTGFHYYFFLLIFVCFMNPMYGRGMRIFLAVSDVVIYLLLTQYALRPWYTVDPLYTELLNIHNILIVTITITILSSVFRKRITETIGDLEMAANTDPLTGLLNRRSMFARLEREHARYQSGAASYCVLLCDIDDFKMFNDLYGHDCGDYVLRECAQAIRGLVRNGDSVSRWGGEEFLILLPATDPEEAFHIAERIRSRIQHSVHTFQGAELRITLTFGLSSCPPSVSVSDCINQADNALMQGKQEGKNCVVSQLL
ncbi:GGDEF domain-containing protein [Paenibacillus mucilaginosus]|nr:GGDEF domain-containing protein [Paenibacillus mucilaginosus]MCG7214909.1 GGDEF domain-containing protein [Paenibacillus mucilaginosus]WDM26386.1 GGDEF domain-containing protein [Paenibacillus mucilaginosus]